MQNDRPMPTEGCMVRNCNFNAETYVGKNSEIAVCGIHAAAYRASFRAHKTRQGESK